jgi:hypothetical protein
VFVRGHDDTIRLFKALSIILAPVAVLMLREHMTGQNAFFALGGVEEVAFRDGKFRAQGPFAHAILAGTVGAVCLPMALYLWNSYKFYSLVGLLAAGGMVFASASSGPAMTVVFSIGALALWGARGQMRAIRWIAAMGVVALDLLMKDPVYYLMARIDITGGSAGWHRARLIQSASEHLKEWWLVGTDYTRHWMDTGLTAYSDNSDITNHFLKMGVWGGIPLMLIFIAILLTAFQVVGRVASGESVYSVDQQFRAWTLGAILFGYVMTFFGISLFGESAVFLFVVLAAIASGEGGESVVHLGQQTSKAERYPAYRSRSRNGAEVEGGITAREGVQSWACSENVSAKKGAMRFAGRGARPSVCGKANLRPDTLDPRAAGKK